MVLRPARSRQPRSCWRSRWPSSAVVLMLGAAAPLALNAQREEVVIEMQPGPVFSIDDAEPMGLRDVASVFPFAGPFAPGQDGAPGDRFLHEALEGVDRGFMNQLMPVLQSRFQDEVHPCNADVARLCPHADAPLHCLGKSTESISKACTQEIKHAVPFVCSRQIQEFCSDDIEKAVLPCLEEQGSKLDADCYDAIIAAKHALSSLAASQKKAAGSMEKARSHADPPPRGASPCPHGKGWSGPQAGGCCTKRWAPSCAAKCAARECADAGNDKWSFKWLDFRHHPYTCCPRSDGADKYMGGQPLCPNFAWSMETQKEGGECCRRGWSWQCPRGCAETQCRQHIGFEWTPVDESKEHYRCCPHGKGGPGYSGPSHAHAGSPSSTKRAAVAAAAAASAEPELPDALGASWISKPIDLSAGGWTTGAFVVGFAALFLLARRYMFSRRDKEL